MTLKPYDTAEPKRFIAYSEKSASGSGLMLTHASVVR